MTRSKERGRWPAASLALLAVAVAAGLQIVTGQKWKTDFGPCYRDCSSDPIPRHCIFDFTEELYATLVAGACKNCSLGVEQDCYAQDCVPADLIERPIYTINRQMPGPSIQVCVGDVIQVNLHVEIQGHAETIHWHGLPQMRTPWYDGVAFVTQCPVIYSNTFRYEFPAEPAGTYFYHSHSGLHKVGGILGNLIIRQRDIDNPIRHLYDLDLPEHALILTDWMHVDPEFVLPGLATRLTGQPSDTLLVNGQGPYALTSTATNQTRKTRSPYATFEVEAGKRYRFRIINSGALSCPISVQIEEHSMLVIATDGLDISPQRADTLYTLSGERWDVVVQAKTLPSQGAFWMYFRTVGFCTNFGTSEQKAILYYKGANSKVPTTPAPSFVPDNHGLQLPLGTVVNSLGDCEPTTQVCATELSALQPIDTYSTAQNSLANTVIFFRLRFARAAPERFFDERNVYEPFLAFGSIYLQSVLNDIVYSPPSSPVLTQAGESAYCNEQLLPERCRGQPVCDCPHLIKVPLGDVVDIIVVDESQITANDSSTSLLAHPMHLHGTSFACMGMGTLRSITNGTDRAAAVRQMYHSGVLPRQVENPALKDVLLLPGGGWIWFRFRADNPGAWFFHCHFQYHMAGGMEAVIQVGDDRQLPPPPPGFPKCGNYLPSEYYNA